MTRIARIAGALATALCVAALVADAAWAQNRPSFSGVGDLAGGTWDSIADDVSNDGAVVVGGSESGAGPQAFRWSVAGGLVGLGDLAGGTFQSHATGVSANGSVIVGTGVNSNDESRAFRWTSGSGLVALNPFFCFLCPNYGFGLALASNGLVATGGSNDSDDTVQASRWTGGGTSISGLGHLSGGGDLSEARGASSTGSVIVGVSDATAGLRAFRWTSSGISALPDIPAMLVDAAANDVSDDGSVIVGNANNSSSTTVQPIAVRWLGPGYTTAQPLGTLPGASFPTSNALAVSANGAIVVGTANDENSDDSAFLWDAANGMRKLRDVLHTEYGLALTGWQLHEARGISDVNASGEFWIVGGGTNPSGNPEGWVALLSKPHCNDGIDNDGDGQTDFGADLQCNAKGDRSETPDCGDGLDNDGDGGVDFPADSGCTASTDRTELFDCGDGLDNDGDGLADLADAGCRSATSKSENPACQNGIDDDGDGSIDFPAERHCVAADDLSEIPDCSDGLDNDGDGLIDSPSDSDCTSTTDPAEDANCNDRIDDDGDYATDFPAAYPNCQSAADTSEAPVCGDGQDNDADAAIDFPADAGCATASFASEAPVATAIGDVLVLDRRSRRLFRLDLATGVQTAISTGAHFGSPQGIETRAGGAVVVADPVGLLQVAPSTGRQRRFSDALLPNFALQVAFDAAGDALVLESDGITRVPYVLGGIAPGTALLTLPVAGAISLFVGDALARETTGDLLVTGFGPLGDGIFRVGATGTPVTKVTPGFSGDTWQDLAVESSGNILAAGTRFGVGTGVFRVHPSTGARTSLSSGSPWVDPMAIAVGTGGQVYVADAGTCTEVSCSGSQVVQLDPATGARLFVRSGGFITGEMDLAVVRERPACGDGLDNDSDLATDFPADPHCTAFEDPSEVADCGNGIDDDGDGLVDFPADLGCLDASSREDPACDDGYDNDGDRRIDWDGGPAGATPDPECKTPSGGTEAAASGGCGIGAEIALALGGIAALRRRRR